MGGLLFAGGGMAWTMLQTVSTKVQPQFGREGEREGCGHNHTTGGLD